MPGFDLTQNQLDKLAQFFCAQDMSQKDKEMMAMEFTKQFEVTRDLRFRRMATIPNIDEDL
jgi:hypothetical protein